MVQLVTVLAALVTAIMVGVKQIEAKLPYPTDPTALATFQSWVDLINLILSMVFGVVGALIMLGNTPTLFSGDSPFIANSPMLFAIVAGLISVLPGGFGVSSLSALLAWLGARTAPVVPQLAGAQVVQGTATPVRRSIALWS